MFKRKKIFADYAAGAPLLPDVRRAMAQADAFFGNPSAIHHDGVASRQLIESTRTEVAECLKALSDEIIFTGSGTESDNLAILGAVRAAQKKMSSVHVITLATEHPAVLEACRALEQEHCEVTYLGVSEDGLVDVKELRETLRPETVLVSIAYANNEIGTIQPIKEIAKVLRHYKKTLGRDTQSGGVYPLFHTDACQAAAYCSLEVNQLGVDLLALNGTKLGGPHGTGILYKKRKTDLTPLVYGGGQEMGLRSGTPNISGIVGCVKALVIAQTVREKESERLAQLRDTCIAHIRQELPTVRINGTITERLPNNVHLSFKNMQSELLVVELDAFGISVSAGSACGSIRDDGSHVMRALYGAGDSAQFGNVRFSFGKKTTRKDVARLIHALHTIQKKYQQWVP